MYLNLVAHLNKKKLGWSSYKVPSWSSQVGLVKIVFFTFQKINTVGIGLPDIKILENTT